MNWNQLSREIARETGCDPDGGFSQDGQHPWVIAAIRIATLKEREARNELERIVMRKLYHATTQKKAKLYRQTGAIKAPVRGFTTTQAAMAWAMKVGRTVIIEFYADRPHKLPDHHNEFGEAWWNDGDVKEWRCIFSANGDA